MTETANEFQRLVDELDETWPVGKQLAIPDGGTVVVLGAYRGKVIAYLLQRYPHIGAIYGFEPQTWAVLEAQQHLAPMDPRVKLYDYGLVSGIETQDRTMGEWATDGCSLVSTSGEIGRAHLEPFAKAMLCIKAEHASWPFETRTIDVLIMNIEGYEWELLTDIVNIPPGGYIVQNQLGWFESLCVQFHEHGMKDPAQHHNIMRELHEHYGVPVYDNYPEWVYWRKR
jgi:hypothetical protein